MKKTREWRRKYGFKPTAWRRKAAILKAKHLKLDRPDSIYARQAFIREFLSVTFCNDKNHGSCLCPCRRMHVRRNRARRARFKIDEWPCLRCDQPECQEAVREIDRILRDTLGWIERYKEPLTPFNR